MSSLHFVRRTPFSYIFTLLICIGVTVVKAQSDAWIGHVTPFLLYFGAIMLSSWVGGIGAGVFAVLLSTAICNIYFLPGPDSAGFDLHLFSRLAIFTAEGTLIAFLTSLARASQEKFARQAERQTVLSQISRLALSENTDSEALYQSIVDGTARALETSRATILQLERQQDDDRFIVRAATGWKTVGPGTIFSAAKETQASFVLAQSEVIVVPDTRNESRFVIPDVVKAEIRSSLLAPIGPLERSWGILAIHSVSPRNWTEEEIGFARAISDTLGVVIEREHARRDVLEGQLRYKNFLEQSSEAIWRFELDVPIDVSLPFEQGIELAWDNCYLAECNDTFAQAYGFPKGEQMFGMRLWQLLKRDEPKNLEYLRAAWENNFKINEQLSEEVDRNGQTRWFLNNLVGIVEKGKLLRIWGTQRDVTDQREANQRVGASEQRFRALFDTSPVAMAIIREGVFLYANRALARMIGFENAEQFVGRSTNEFIPLEYHRRVSERISKFLEDESQTVMYEIEGIRSGGLRFPMRVEIASLSLADGQATMAFVFDLTEDRRSQNEIAALLKKERRATKRAIRLQEIATALSRPVTTRETAHIAIDRALDALGASGGLIMVPGQGIRQTLSILEEQEFPAELLDFNQQPGNKENHPIMVSFRENEPLWMSDLDLWVERFPVFNKSHLLTHTRALAIIPLEVEGNVAGVLGLSFPQTRQFDEEQRAFIITLGNQIAGSLERARLDAASKELARRQQESLALLNTLLDSAPVGFALFDRNGRYVLLNDALANINGVALEDHLGKKTSQVIPSLGTIIDEKLLDVWRSGKPSSKMDITIPAGDSANPDALRHCLTSFYPVQVASGEILGVGAVVLEITDRVRAEREKAILFDQLEVERARFEAILQQMPSAVVIGEAPSGRLILGNSQVDSIWRHEYRDSENFESYGKSYKGFLLSGREMPTEEWPLARAIQKGETIAGEEILIERGDGTMGVIRLNAAPIRDKDNNITAGVVIFDDVTERAKNEAAQRFLAEASSALISTIDERESFEKLAQICVTRVADWCIMAVSSDGDAPAYTALAHSKISNKNLEGHLKAQLDADPRLPWNIEDIAEDKHAVLYDEVQIKDLQAAHISPEYIRIFEQMGIKSVIVAPLAARGRLVGTMIWLTAESGRKYDEKDLELADELAKRAALTADNARLLHEAETARDAAQNARDEAEGANRAKDEFLAVVSHELRTPLTPILGWLELLRMHESNEKLRQQAYNVIERNANAQAQLVNDILDVSRITTGKLRMDLRSCTLAPLVDSAIESLKPMAAEKKIRIETFIQDVGEVNADASRIQQVVWNLLQNAIKFTPEEGRISIELSRGENETAKLCITDTGQGIPTAFLPHVFDRFRQADSSSTRKQGGLGLGLAIVTHIVELHGGKVSATSAGADQGSSFCVELPLFRSDVIISLNPRVSTLGQQYEFERGERISLSEQLKGIRVLLVDDEPDTRETLARLLESAGATIRVAPSAMRAIEMMPQFSPDILVSDIAMPEMDGYELLSMLRENEKMVPAIALTAYAAPSDVQKAMSAGFQKHLAKPVISGDLIRMVQELTKN